MSRDSFGCQAEGDVTGICWTEATGATTQPTMQRAVFQNKELSDPKCQ